MFSKLLLKLIVLFLVLSFLGCPPSPKSSLPLKEEPLAELITQYDSLTKEYQQKLKKDPDNLELRLQVAYFYYEFRDYQKVKELAASLDSSEAKVLLAKALAKLKEYDYAIEIFEQLKPQPKDPEYLYLYGQVLEKKNLFPQALKVYKKVGSPFAHLAKERIKAIKTKAEDKIPPLVLEISKAAQEFLQSAKDDAAMILLVDEEIQITPENTSVSTIHVIKKILKERGKALAEVEVGYDSTYERIELEFARTITQEGKVVYAGAESVRDVSRYLNFPLYSNSRAFIVSMPSVDVGSFIEYKIKIHSSKLIAKDNFSFIYRLREAHPIFKADFRLIMPQNREAYFKFFNQEYAKEINLRPQLGKGKDKKIYSWSFNEIKPIIPEYGMPPDSLVNPAVLISSFSSWEQIYKWWHRLWQDKIELDKTTKDFVAELIKDVVSDLDKAKKIYEYVAKNIRYVAIEYGDSGYEPHHAQDVFINRYGDCKDQAILLVAMLREAGLAAYPVLIPTRATYPINKDFPSLNFNHAICALKIGQDLIFMDSTSETSPFLEIPLSDQERPVMVFFDDHWLITDTVRDKDNGVYYEMDIVIDDQENATIIRNVSTKGFFAAAYRWYLKYTHPAIIKEDIQKKMVEISSLSRLINYEIKNVDDLEKDPVLTYKFKADKFLNPARDLRIVPVLDQIQLDHNLIGKEERNFPIDFEGNYTKAAKIQIILPKDLKIKYLPRSTVLENPWFQLKVFYQDRTNYINFYQEFVNKKRFVARQDYQKFKKHLEDALYLLREEIVLEKVK